MPSVDVINGTNLRVYIGGNAVAYSTNCTLTGSRELRELIHKDNPGSGFRNIKVGRGQYTCTVEGLYAEDGANNKPIDLIGFFRAKTSLTCRLSTEVTGDNRYEFTGFVTQFEVGAPVEDNSTFNVTIEVDGDLTPVVNT